MSDRSASIGTWGAAALVAAVGGWLYSQWSLNHDAAVFLLIARAIADGRVLYETFPDYSMPANTWLAALSLHMADLVDIWPAYIHQALLFGLSVLGAGMTGLVVFRAFGAQSLVGRIMPSLIMWLFLVIPGYDFGQRDVLFAVLAAPLVAIVAARHFGIAPSRSFSLLIAGLATIGSSLKPHVALPLLVLSACDLVLRRGRIATVARELWLTAGMLALYAIVVQVLYPTYFGTVLSDAAKINAFIQIGAGPVMWSLFSATVAGLVSIGLLLAILVRRASSRRPNLWSIVIAWAAFAISLSLMKIMQFQEFRYHTLPVILYALTSVCLFAAINVEEVMKDWGDGFTRAMTGGTTAVLTTLIAIAMIAMETPSKPPEGLSRAAVLSDPVTRMLQSLPRGTYVLALQTSVRPISPLHAYADIRWSGEFYENHEIAAVAYEHDEAAAAGRISAPFFVALEQRIRHAVLRSLTSHVPDVVLVDISRPLRWFEDYKTHFELLSWFKQDPAFASAWSAYQCVGTVSSLGSRKIEVWRRYALQVD